MLSTGSSETIEVTFCQEVSRVSMKKKRRVQALGNVKG
jgi:hypothetical protein